jgi:hypothetical protein
MRKSLNLGGREGLTLLDVRPKLVAIGLFTQIKVTIDHIVRNRVCCGAFWSHAI